MFCKNSISIYFIMHMLHREFSDQDETARSIAHSKEHYTKAIKLPQENTTRAAFLRSSIKIMKYNR